MKVAALTGDALVEALPEVAALRIAVFREWPYLYDGDLAYEEHYLRVYAENPRAILVAAIHEDRLVGASTGIPLLGHDDAFNAAFADGVYPEADVFYCAESVLLPEYRGQGLGHAFFDQREEHARRLGYRYCAFCAVDRSEDHPLRPKQYRALDPFWTARGYAHHPSRIARFEWKDVDQPVETAKRLSFWIKDL
jgi:GNAT superfamily N-acetyltransferase